MTYEIDEYEVCEADETDVEETDGEKGICPNCGGSGEGRYEGTRCSTCKGSGES